MKRILLIALACCGVLSLSAYELKVLMIGNSFSNSLFAYLPKMVEAGKTYKLKLANAYIGGCTLERHCRNVDAEKTDPELKPYSFIVTGEKSRKEKLSVMLKADKWDIVTIQQGSRHSPYKEKTHELAKKLMAFVKVYAPQAEIVVHETWAYSGHDSWFRKKDFKPNTRQMMHEMVKANYTELAKTHKLRMIPVGNAVQLFREKLPVKQVAFNKADLKKLVAPNVIDISGGDVVGKIFWRKDRKDPSKVVLSHDTIHMNDKGKYLQAAVWYMFLFDAKAADIKLPYNDPSAKLMLECAEKAVADSK